MWRAPHPAYANTSGEDDMRIPETLSSLANEFLTSS